MALEWSVYVIKTKGEMRLHSTPQRASVVQAHLHWSTNFISRCLTTPGYEENLIHRYWQKGYDIPGVELEASGDESLAPTLGELLDVRVGVAGCRWRNLRFGVLCTGASAIGGTPEGKVVDGTIASSTSREVGSEPGWVRNNMLWHIYCLHQTLSQRSPPI